MRTSMIVCVIAASLCVMAQETPQPTVDANLAAAITGVQIQQFLSNKYANLILDYQSAMGWMQVARGWSEMTERESTGKNFEEQPDLEESDSEVDDDDKSSFIQEEFLPFASAPAAPVSNAELERNTEYQLLYVLKLMYVQAANKLSATQQSHYQTKLQLALLQGVAGNNVLGPLLYLMYYSETLKVMSSSITIQRQDSWNTWLLYEILETDELKNVRGFVPYNFQTTMAQARIVAGSTWQMETTLDLTILYIDFYIQMIVGQMSAQPAPAPAPAAPATPATPQGAVFLEEGVSAEPNKPFFPFAAAAGLAAPQYMVYYQAFLKFWAATMHAQAAQGFVLSSQVDNPQLSSHIVQSKQYMASALQQWAWLKLMSTMMDYYTLVMMMQQATPQGAHNGAATASNFVQTEATAGNALQPNK